MDVFVCKDCEIKLPRLGVEHILKQVSEGKHAQISLCNVCLEVRQKLGVLEYKRQTVVPYGYLDSHIEEVLYNNASLSLDYLERWMARRDAIHHVEWWKFSRIQDRLYERERKLIPIFKAMDDYKPIPGKILSALINWAWFADKPGGFVSAVIRDELHAAISTADKESLAAIRPIIIFMYNRMPRNSWGDIDHMATWKGDKDWNFEL